MNADEIETVSELVFEDVVRHCACATYDKRGDKRGEKYTKEELWRRIELTLHNMSRILLTEMAL